MAFIDLKAFASLRERLDRRPVLFLPVVKFEKWVPDQVKGERRG